MLQERLKDYLDQSEIVKTLNRDLKELTQEDELYPQIEVLSKEVKELKEKLMQKTEIALVKEKRDGAKERLGLLKDILHAEMAESGESEVEVDGKKAKIISQVKFEKAVV